MHTHAHCCVPISMQRAEFAITSGWNMTTFTSALRNQVPRKCLQFLHWEENFLKVAVMLSRGWKQWQMQFLHHHFIMYISVKQLLCDSIRLYFKVHNRVQGIQDWEQSCWEVAQGRWQCRGSESRPDSPWWRAWRWSYRKAKPHLKAWEVKRALNRLLGENPTWSHTESYREVEVESYRKVTFILRIKVSQAFKDVLCTWAQQWTQGWLWGFQCAWLKLISSDILVWLSFNYRVPILALCLTERKDFWK